ncbi:helix-turn-helix domain-containing protein [Saccharothrix australiensis]|uniref:Helix-turn-helix protein n=1 Tax=Saccharothrix australiensis TaxID=2072 RepID=A0A495VXR3_9PSEU|nr:helix-turn-helix protein [Saccharothrix australiensis]
MPGSRLTGADRRRIAAGLAQGLDYAGIARRLGRPTSTVSREVARNGGPGRYRADLAQFATTHRARRSPRPQAPARPDDDRGGLDPGAVAAFTADLTAAIVDTGMPRTAAGVMACLLTAETGSRTSAEPARDLRVSAATISHAVGLLRRQGLIRHARDGRSRRHRYFLDEDAGPRSAVVGARANQRLSATALRGAEVFGAGTAVGTRLVAAGRFLAQLGDDILRAAEERRRATTGTGPEHARTAGATTAR